LAATKRQAAMTELYARVTLSLPFLRLQFHDAAAARQAALAVLL
jgi:hypothetical protein